MSPLVRRRYISHEEAHRLKDAGVVPMPAIADGRQEIRFDGVELTDVYVVDDHDPRLGTVTTEDE